MKKVTVYGGTNNKSYTAQEMEECKKLGKYLAKKGLEVLTGACNGFPLFVGREAIAHGGKVVGYSPARNKKDHVQKYNFPIDGVTHLEFIEKDGQNPAENFLKRSWDMNYYSDIVIALGGSWGTYTELLFSFWYKKTIILVTSFGGAVEAFDNTWNFFNSRDINPAVHNGAKLIKVANIEEAIKVFEAMDL